MRFAPQAWPWVVPCAVAAPITYFFVSPLLAAGLIAFAIAILFFFRDPSRACGGPEGAILCPADGVVTAVDEIVDEQVDSTSRQRIVIFLNVFNVHVQRSPCTGKVVKSLRREGKKLAAYREDVDKVNASHLTVLQQANGSLVSVRQIAGLVARRVVPYLSVGDEVQRSERLGVIQFGSRVDILIPEGYTIEVTKGDKVRSVATVLAQPQREDL